MSLSISLTFTGARMSQLVAELLPTLGGKSSYFYLTFSTDLYLTDAWSEAPHGK
jgi:hypothetical protein